MSDNEKDSKKIFTQKHIKTPYDAQRYKLEKLMKNPAKPVFIPERTRDKKQMHVPDFVRNVMGSSAGAGSGEFHVYRHLRRKEYSRQKQMTEMSEKERLDEEFRQKLLDKQRSLEEKTAKKRQKRLKKKEKYKQKLKQKRHKTCNNEIRSNSDDDEKEESESENDSELGSSDKNVSDTVDQELEMKS